MVTHVVTVAPAQERFLEDALVSVRRQTYLSSRLVVVRWGEGTDNPDLASARNRALEVARGRYARLLEASDTLPWHSTALLVRALAGTGWASAAGRSRRGNGWRDTVFAPAPGLDPGLADRIIDLARWRSAGAAFDPTHGRFGDAVFTALDAAGGVVPIADVTHEDRDRTLGLPFGHVRRWSEEIDAWLAAVETAAPQASADWAGSLLDHRLPAVLGDVERFNELQWARLHRLVGSLLTRLGDESGEVVRVESRILAWLTGVNARERVTDLVLRRWRGPDDLPTTVRDGVVLADLGIDGLPEAVRRLGRRETPLELIPVRRTAGSLELTAFIRGVATDEPPQVRARVAGVELVTRSSATPAATRIAGEAEHLHDHAWLEVELGSGAVDGVLEVELTSHGLIRHGTVEVPAVLVPEATTDPRGDDEIGPYAQLRLQRWYAEPHPIEPDLMYFQSYTGQSATDSPLAIYRALRRTHPGIRARWLVESLDVPVPEGSEPVLIRSREWYQTLATAHGLVLNIEPERWFRRRPGQVLVQTWHGNPGKTMGLSAWRQSGYTPRQIEQTLDHGPRNWSLLVSPSPEMTELYRREFTYEGPVVDHGYPRDDDLVAISPERRSAARRGLGIDEGQIAVLYAPTWRPEQAVNHRRAHLAGGLEVAAAARSLGERYTLLLRGHRFHVERDGAAGARVLDVTEHPEVNDLIMAADAAVLDYSSIRFDFALTGRPMVFHVPDLDTFNEQRGFLYDYADSAPGPRVQTTGEVVAALRDLDTLERDYAEAREAFRRRFNAHQDGHSAERVVEAMLRLGDVAG